MAKGYWVARVDVHDAEAYKGYVAANGAAFAKFGGRFVVRGGQFQNPVGTSRSRNVVIEFPVLPGGPRLLELGRVPGGTGEAAGRRRDGPRDHRRLRRTAARLGLARVRAMTNRSPAEAGSGGSYDGPEPG
jgi:hypothetical protein